MNIVGISTCKGRLDHIKQSSKSFINSNQDVSYLLVDFACPQYSSKWVEKNLNNQAKSIRISEKNSEKFHKTIALNAGGKYAIANMNADYLLFFDADTIIKEGFVDKLKSIPLTEDKFLFIDPYPETKDLTGLIVVHQKLFRESGGFEESFQGWGAEDLEFRLRLYSKHKRNFTIINGDFLDSIPHDNDLRTKFYKEKDPDISNKKNINRMRKMFSLYRNGDDLKKWKSFPDAFNIKKLLGLY